ncbi:MAG TPA: beta-ketoacyl synthase N-terminal-like domain-containing protein [Holophagaceae bacterium]
MSGDLVLTGLGLVLPCGDGIDAARASLRSGTPCFAELPESLGRGRGAACKDFNPAGIIPPMQLRRLDRCSRFAWGAAHQAFADAGLDPRPLGHRIAVAAGTLTGGSEATEGFLRPYLQRGPEGASPLLFPNSVANAASGHLAQAFGLKGPSATFLEWECATFAALEQAARWLRSGMAEAALVLGTDGLFPLLLEIARGARLLARHGDPVAGSGCGFLPGEGAQAFLLETRDHAEARGARIRATLASVAGIPALANDPLERALALAEAVDRVLPDLPPDRWIGGSCGSSRIDPSEASLGRAHSGWPAPLQPKLLWGEFAGAGGPLLAAALLEPATRVLVTAPASFGPQYAARFEGVRL